MPVLEGRHCFPSLTVEENLVTGALGRDARRAEIEQGLEKVYAIFPRLKERRRSPAGLTSGGEQQMTAIGRALLARPACWCWTSHRWDWRPKSCRTSSSDCGA